MVLDVRVLRIISSVRSQFTAHEERHQWLELTLRPSLQTYVCDLWVADAVGNDALRWSIVEEGFCLASSFWYSCWSFGKL